MENSEKVIDLLDLSKYLWNFKLFIIICALIGGIIGFGYGYMTVVPMYQSSIDIQLPLYCDNNTIGTAQIVARGEKLLIDVEDKLEIKDHPIQVIPSHPGNTTIIHVTFRGKDPQLIKKYADVYQTAFIQKLDGFINEKTISDMQKANLQTATPLTKGELLEKVSLSQPVIIKEAGIPTVRVDEGYSKTTFYGIVFGIIGSIVIFTFNYIRKI